MASDAGSMQNATLTTPRAAVMTRLSLLALVLVSAARGDEVGRGGVFSVVELTFTGPAQTAADTPARDIDFRVTFRHESGSPSHTVYGFFDGDGKGGAAGSGFKVRFCPTKPGRWDLTEVRSSAKELAGQNQGGYVSATLSKRPGFWEVDADHAGGRWYKRTDGSHPYVVGNTQYSFLSGMRDTGPVPGFDLAADIRANAAYFKKLRFALTADRYPHPADKPFLDATGKPTDDGNFSGRPNPAWFHQRADVAVRAAYQHDLVADLILCGPDTDEARATLRAAGTGGDALPWLRYVVARYGSYPNVWLCLCNEYEIKAKYPPADIARWGVAVKGLLPHPTPLSVHASQFPDGQNRKDGKPDQSMPAWSAKFDALPPWNDHMILQRKLRNVRPAADVIRRTHDNPGGTPRLKPTVNDELSYQGEGDKHTEGDTLASHLGAFLGGGYASTGWKPGNKLGHYFWGQFDPKEHTAARGLKYLRETIDKHVTFWRMEPDATIFPGLDPAYRALAWPGHEYVLGTDKAGTVTAELPAGAWRVARYDLVTQTAATISEGASGKFTFDAPDSRAVLVHIRKVGGPAKAGGRVVFDVDLTKGVAGPGVVTGGKWDGGWRIMGAKDERIVFDAGRPIANGCLEARVTTPRLPWGKGAEGKVNWVGLYEDAALTQSAHRGDLFYARVGSPGYKFSCVKAAGRPFDRTEYEPRVGAETDWVADDRTVMTVKLEWRDGVPVFHDPTGRATVFPRDVIGADSPVDRLRYVFLGSDRFTGLTVPGLRFLSAKLTDYGDTAAGPEPERLKVHDNGRCLVTASGGPVFLLADTAWNLAQKLTRDEVSRYLLRRRGQRFNAVAFVLYSPGAADLAGPADAAGAEPFVNGDLGRPADGAYWANIDFLVAECRRLGLYALVHPCWGSAVVGDYTGQPEKTPRFTPETADRYGRWLGARYGKEPHLVWVLGGDRSAVNGDIDSRPVFRALAEGLADGARAAGDPALLMTYHPKKGGPQSSGWFHADPWLSFNSVQEWPDNQLPAMATDRGMTPAKPTWVFEGRYEGYWKNKHKPEDWGEWPVRLQAYQSVFAGAFGHTYGHERVYGFGKDGADWRAFLDAPGARSMTHLARLMNTLAPQVRAGLVPDQSLIDGDAGKAERLRSDRVTAFRSDSRGVVAGFYTAAGKPVRVNLAKLTAGPMNAWWFNPRTGGWATAAGESPELAIFEKAVVTGSGAAVRAFVPPGPAGDGNDWVLLLGKNPAMY